MTDIQNRMISKSKIQLITSLSLKKKRDELSLFVAEGSKLVLDLANSFTCEILVASSHWLSENRQIDAVESLTIESIQFKKISNQQSPQGVLAVFRKPNYEYKLDEIISKLSLVLDDVQDPGNLGTIIRIADWFGITDVFCSSSSADAFSPKAVQSSMGALARVKVHYVSLSAFLETCKGKLPIYGTFMNGDDIYDSELSIHGLIVMGNEGNGVCASVEAFVSNRLFIPSYPLGVQTSESLNVAVASALVCGEFRRRIKLQV